MSPPRQSTEDSPGSGGTERSSNCAAKRLTWETAVDPRHFKGAHLSQSRFQQSTIYAHSCLNNAVLMVNTPKDRRQSQSFRLFVPYLSSCIEFWAKEEKNLALYPSDGALAQDSWAHGCFMALSVDATAQQRKTRFEDVQMDLPTYNVNACGFREQCIFLLLFIVTNSWHFYTS